MPPGILNVEVDGQPIDAAVVPVTSNATPWVTGRADLGLPVLELAIADGDVIRFSAEVDAEGQFQGATPEPLVDGQYSLYISDMLIGVFIVEGAPPEEREPGAPLDIARVVPYPADFGERIPGIGFLDGRFYTLQEEAARTAVATNGETPNVRQLERRLAEAGWLQRYENRLAAPHPDNPAAFSALVTSFVVEYASGADARSAFAALVGEEPGVAFTTIGNESVLTVLTGVTPDTSAEYQAARLVYRVGPMLGMIVYADLLNQPPDLALLESVAEAVAARAVFVADRQVVPLGSMALRLNASAATARVVRRDLYDARGGSTTTLYNADEATRESRAALLSGATDAFSASTQGAFFAEGGSQPVTPTVNGEQPTPTSVIGIEGGSPAPEPGALPETPATPATEIPAERASRPDVAMTSELFAFPSAADADVWLTARRDALAAGIESGESGIGNVTDSPALGDATAAYSVERAIDEEGPAARGYRIYTRTGPTVAVIEVISAPGIGLSAVAIIMEQQLACIAAGGCPGLASLPE